MTRDRRDRDRATCPSCGKDVTVRRDGGLMAHRADGRPCVAPAWAQRRASAAAPPLPMPETEERPVAAGHRTGWSRAGGRLRAVCQTCPWTGPDRGPWPEASDRAMTAAHLDAQGHRQATGGVE